MSVQPSQAEELPETAVKAWKRRFLAELHTSQPLLFFFTFCSRNRPTGSEVHTLLVYDRAISAGHAQEISAVYSVQTILIFISLPMSMTAYDAHSVNRAI